MNRFRKLFVRLRKKGVRGSLRVLRERYIYRHWELLVLERDLSPPLINRPRLERWPAKTIDASDLPALELHFSAYLPAIRDLLVREGVEGYVHFDSDGQAACMAWVSDRDYFDSHLYRCWIRLPPYCIYQFAGEVAPPYRFVGLPVLVMKVMWAKYQALGFRTTRALVNTRNDIALRTHVRMGFREIGESTHVYCLFRCLHFSRREHYSQSRLPVTRSQVRKKEFV